MRALGLLLLGMVAAFAIGAPLLAPNDPATPFADRSYAPPTWVHVRDGSGWHGPFIYRQVMVDRLTRQFAEDRSSRAPVEWFTSGHLMVVDPNSGPLLLWGADALGRDTFSRVAYGARLSLGVTVLGAGGALLVGAALGAIAAVVGGLADTALMALADFMLVLPAVYLLLVLRAVLPLTLGAAAIFGLMATLFAASGWPGVARGVRAIVTSERVRDYAQAARAIGAGPWRIVCHLLPAATGFLLVEFVLLVPAMLVAEATLSFLGMGFPDARPSWGTMLEDAGNVILLPSAPWLLMPAVLLFVVVFAAQIVVGQRAERTLLTAASRS